MTQQSTSEKNRRSFVLHIGLPKTGTTTLQKLLFFNHPEIYYLGKHQGWKLPKRARSIDIYRMLAPMLWPHDRQIHSIPGSADLQAVLRNVPDSSVLVGSWEGLGATTVEEHLRSIRLLLEAFGNCRVMICLRNPLDLMPSLYLQSLRGRQSETNQKLLNKRWYCEIDLWMQRWRDRGGFEGLLSYGERIRETIQVLGRENVGVYLFEDLCSDQDQFVRSVCRFLRIDEEQGIALAKAGHLHKRLTQGQVEFMKSVDRSFWKRLLLSRLSPQLQRRLLDRQDVDGPPARVRLPDAWAGQIADATLHGNRWLAETLQLPLEKYNYPV
jgi:hypothetical protein